MITWKENKIHTFISIVEAFITHLALWLKFYYFIQGDTYII